MMLHYYEEPTEDGSVGVHVGYEIGDQPVPPGEGIQIVNLPVVEVASVVHRGSMEDMGAVYRALIRWIRSSGYQLAGHGRELYREMTDDGPRVTEVQLPIARQV